jgi:hypothetical protein
MYANEMSKSHAVRYGFSAVFRRPLVFAAELAWRCTFGAAAFLLVAYSVLLFLHSLPVSDADLFGLSGIIPGTYRSALAHIFSGSGPKIARLIIVLTPGIAFLWWLASAFGRAAVLRELLSGSGIASAIRPKRALRVLLQLHFLRTLIAIFALIGYAGCIAFASRAAVNGAAVKTTNTVVADWQAFYLVLIPLALIVTWIWSTVSWYLTLAPIFALQQGTGTFDSVLGATSLSTSQLWQFAWVGLVFGILKLGIFAAAFFFAMTSVGITAQLLPELATFSLFVVFLGYCAASDFLTTARMASYVRIIEWNQCPSRLTL